MVAVVYGGSLENVEKRLNAIVEREAKNGFVPKCEYSYAQKGRVFIGTVLLIANSMKVAA